MLKAYFCSSQQRKVRSPLGLGKAIGKKHHREDICGELTKRVTTSYRGSNLLVWGASCNGDSK